MACDTSLGPCSGATMTTSGSGCHRSPFSDISNCQSSSTPSLTQGIFRGDRQVFDLPLTPIGTEFQSTIWKSLTEMFGSTMSYSEQATSLVVRAQFVPSLRERCNPISDCYPCHRVIAHLVASAVSPAVSMQALVARTRAQTHNNSLVITVPPAN